MHSGNVDNIYGGNNKVMCTFTVTHMIATNELLAI